MRLWLGGMMVVLAAACSSSGGTNGGTSEPDASTSNDGGGPATDGGSTDGGGSDGGITCPSAPRTDALLAQRQACAFQAGDHASTTVALGEAERAAIPIKHVIVVMKENRSFDHIFGGLKALQPDVDVADATFLNKDKSGADVAPFHAPNTCIGFDPDHQWVAMHAQVNGGKMDGFVTSAAQTAGGDGHFVMSHYEPTDLPFYYWLASTYSIADRYFASVRSGTYPNRDYMLLGTSDKVNNTQPILWPDPSLPTIFDELDAAKVTWGVYGDDHPLEETLNNPAKSFEATKPWHKVSDLLQAFADDTVPSVVFVDGVENVQDEHPMGDVQVGEAWTKALYDAAVASKAWSSTAILFTYDEAGGFADHVPPSNAACVARPADSAYFELGTRVPLVAISPWARRHYVSHVPKEHTSITRFIESVFDLPALTARDANSDALLDMFDFACPPAPIDAAPAAGTGGCGAGATLTLDKASFASGETITVHFAGGPANPKDWIGVFPSGAAPKAPSTLWGYCATNAHTASAAGAASGTVTLDANSASSVVNWPLAAGSSWTAYYLVNDGYTSIASVPFSIQN